LELRDHRKEDLFNYVLPYCFDPKAECPQWHKFLDRVLPEKESQQVLREFIDYCFMKDHRMEKMLLLYGGGLNGKSVTLEIIECLLGNYFGPIIILSGLVQGLGFELIIALKGYKKFDRLTMIQGAIICSVLTLCYNLVISGYSQIAVPVLAIMLVVRIISAIIFDAFITPALADGLARAGVLKGYAVAQGLDQDLEEE
jgi:hypothetical protein